jgi:hypothetical protein
MRSTAVRLTSVACLLGVAATHLMDLPDKLEEAHYMAVMFIGLIASSLVLAAAVAAGRRAETAIAVSGVLAALTIAGFVASRTIGLPQLEDHVGQWEDPIGIVSLVCETVLVVIALAPVVHWPRVRAVPAPQA